MGTNGSEYRYDDRRSRQGAGTGRRIPSVDAEDVRSGSRSGSNRGSHRSSSSARRRTAPSGGRSSQGREAAGRQQERRRPANDVEIVYPDGYRPINSSNRGERDLDARPYRSKRDEDAESSRSIFKILLLIVASLIYWPIALVGVVSPFMEGFNPGGLAMWQVVFSRFWLAFVLLGAIYAVVVNLGHIRDARIFQGRRKVLKLIGFLLVDFAISFVLLRVICMF